MNKHGKNKSLFLTFHILLALTNFINPHDYEVVASPDFCPYYVVWST